MKTLFKNATLYPVTAETFQGDLLVENGKIISLERGIQIDEGTEVIDATGMHLLPGFIDVHTHLGLYDEGTGWAGNDANETNDPLTPHIRAIDGVHPLDIGFNDAIKFGITTAHVMPGSANVIGGQTAVIKTYGKNIEKMIIKEKAGLKIALGENPKRIHSGRHNDSITRMGIMGMLREEFYKALNTDNPECLRTAPILSVLKREMPVRIHAHRADDILSAVRFADEFNLDLRIEHCTEGHLIASELEGRDLQVSVGPTLTRKSKIELKNKTWQTYKVLNDHGIAVSITTDHPYVPIQYLNVCAAIAIREGLSVDQALRGITINPAVNLGINHQVGSLEVGKDADITLWNDHPFQFSAIPNLTMIDGQIVYQKSY
ncbi:amidohydrolase [Pseudalkalibacillus berkeleyi]|uniref:Amidohydrolase n=1 Tax=Pseudalkalibacillus berkeleyi TaxID=1069813 RepID=A0ABS9H5B8_9BACL|nr:amidohydrolase [Pseudalkalibacillus berkeleyi]MCF6139306.1 amidohydrolase [Pseudalkalibacillus berkeleyi]